MWTKVKRYFWNILLVRDHTVNVYLGGDPHETISSRVWRSRDKKYMWLAIKLIDGVLGKGHCQGAEEPAAFHKDEVIR